MADDKKEMFLSRWSRRKHDAQAAAVEGSAVPDPAQPLAEQENSIAADTPLPQLPPVEELTLDSDFSGFLHPKVAQDVKRAALKKLFSDPHFNVMDGLDIYIDDYSKPDPLPADMLAQMRSAQAIFRWASDADGADESAAAPPPAAEAIDTVAPPAPTLSADSPAPAQTAAEAASRPATMAEAVSRGHPAAAATSRAETDNKS